MTWRSLSFKNTRANGKRYLGYLMSSSVAVMFFFMFAAFAYNPRVQHGYMPNTARHIFNACEYIIIAFSVFFVFFFHAALLRLRSREFGLFLVLGVTPRQIGRMVLGESLYLGAMSMVIGSLLGILFTKLFLLAMSTLLQLHTSISFMIPHHAWVLTFCLFVCVFVLEGIVSSVRTARHSPKALIIGRRTRQNPPKFSVWKVIFALVCLSGAYALALFSPGQAVVVTTLPILILTSIGTYILYSQASVFILSYLRRRLLAGTNMLVVGRMAHRMRDHARVLTVVTLLTALIITSMGALYAVKQSVIRTIEHENPFSLMLVTNAQTPSRVTPNVISDIFHKNHVSVTNHVALRSLIGYVTLSGSNTWPTFIIPMSEYEQSRQLIINNGEITPTEMPNSMMPTNGHGLLVIPPQFLIDPSLRYKQAVLAISQHKIPVEMNSQKGAEVFNEQAMNLPSFAFIVTDHDFAALSQLAPPSAKWTLHGYMASEDGHFKQSLTQIMNMEPSAEQSYLTSGVFQSEHDLQILSVMLFAGLFMSILFFLACGSAIYFRLQAQREEDREQFHALRRLGISQQEAKQVLIHEIRILFFVPFLLAMLHSGVAMLDLAHLMPLYGSGWSVFGTVVLIYLLCMVFYYLTAKIQHVRQVVS